MAYNYYCYITASLSKTIYIGVTNDLELRVHQHRSQTVCSFTSRYNIDRLVWFEHTLDVKAAITREKQIKGWKRMRKIALIEGMNPEWDDLSRTILGI